MNQTIQEYQQDCWKSYKTKIGLPENYNYLYGNPVKVHVPVDVATGGLMIVGAYPTAQFNSIEDSQGKIILDVPVANHLFPFSNDKYFDGSRVTSSCNLIRISGRAREPMNPRLNRLKKSNPEAFFYWYRIATLNS